MGAIFLVVMSAVIVTLTIYFVFLLANQERTMAAVKSAVALGLSEDEMLADYRRKRFSLSVLAVGAFLFTVGFAAVYFTGADIDEFANMATEKWIAFGAGAIIVLGVTLYQFMQYQSVIGLQGAAIAITGVLLFVFFSEISTSMERNDVLMRHRSETSKAVSVAEKIAGLMAGKTTSQPYVDKIAKAHSKAARHQAEFKYCAKKYKHHGRARILRCEEYEQRKVDRYTAQAKSYESQQSDVQGGYKSATDQAISNVDQYSRNEEYHLGVIRQIAGAFGVSTLSASMFLALIFVNAFELAFHAAGVMTAISATALNKIGVNLHEGTAQRRRKKRGRREVELVADAEDQMRRRTNLKQKSSKKSVSMATPESQTFENPGIGFQVVKPKLKPKSNRSKINPGGGVLRSVAGVDVAAMMRARDDVANAHTGDTVACPACATEFTKRGRKIFCSSKGVGNCADAYRNLTRGKRG